jgi:DNA replication and repair protein RecF
MVGKQKLELDWQDGSRKLKLDGVLQSRSEFYLASGRITWFGNEDMELIRGGAAARRRFLDFIGSQLVPGYAQALRAYDRALRSRNFLLREGRPRREVVAYDEPLLQHGASLWHGRGQFYRELTGEVLQAVGEIGGVRESWSLSWVPQPDLAIESFAGSLRASESEEMRLRQTTVGPHRDDYRLLLHGQAAADFASEGQQRTLALALKLAQARLLARAREDPPILLLDDIFGELDPQRRNRLFAALPAESQKFVTTTFLDWAELPRDASVVELAISSG